MAAKIVVDKWDQMIYFPNTVDRGRLMVLKYNQPKENAKY